MVDATNNTGTVDNSSLANVIAAAVGAAVTSSLQEITNKLNEITQVVESRVKQTSANDDSNFETSVVGVFDPYDDPRRAGMVNHRVSVSMAENMDAMMKEYLKYTAGIWARSLDHFCSSNPETPPRAAKQ